MSSTELQSAIREARKTLEALFEASNPPDAGTRPVEAYAYRCGVLETTLKRLLNAVVADGEWVDVDPTPPTPAAPPAPDSLQRAIDAATERRNAGSPPEVAPVSETPTYDAAAAQWFGGRS